jgi:CRP-like cAMP-binding protein
MGQQEFAGFRDQRGWGAWQWPSSSVLGSLIKTSRDRLLESGTTRQYVAGQILIREGETSKFVIVLLDGVVKATGLTLEPVRKRVQGRTCEQVFHAGMRLICNTLWRVGTGDMRAQTR